MNPDFAEVYESYERDMLEDAYHTIRGLDLWEWFRQFEPHPNEGFMFTADIHIATIGNAMTYKSHSGASFGWTMRAVHDIARRGWTPHKYSVIEQRGAPCPCRRARGKLTGWCGNAGGGVPACDH